MRINKEGIELIKLYEGFEAKAYICPAGKLTIGYGHAIQPREEHLKTATLSKAEAHALLIMDLIKRERAVSDMVTYKINGNQFSALVSFVYNLGAGALQKSTLLKYLNLGKVEDAAVEILKWNKGRVDGKLIVLDGLTERRKAERELFLKQI